MSYSRRALIAGLAATVLEPRRARAASVTDGAGRTVLVPARVERVFPAGPVRDLSLCAKHFFSLPGRQLSGLTLKDEE
jgi:ABC-type Fe3+-hydroxamate transport system substrate-binding protein